MQSFWDIIFELVMITQFFHLFISVYIMHLILLYSHNMAGYGDAKPKFHFLAKFYTSDCSHVVAS